MISNGKFQSFYLAFTAPVAVPYKHTKKQVPIDSIINLGEKND